MWAVPNSAGVRTSSSRRSVSASSSSSSATASRCAGMDGWSGPAAEVLCGAEEMVEVIRGVPVLSEGWGGRVTIVW